MIPVVILFLSAFNNAIGGLLAGVKVGILWIFILSKDTNDVSFCPALKVSVSKPEKSFWFSPVAKYTSSPVAWYIAILLKAALDTVKVPVVPPPELTKRYSAPILK